MTESYETPSQQKCLFRTHPQMTAVYLGLETNWCIYKTWITPTTGGCFRHIETRGLVWAMLIGGLQEVVTVFGNNAWEYPMDCLFRRVTQWYLIRQCHFLTTRPMRGKRDADARVGCGLACLRHYITDIFLGGVCFYFISEMLGILITCRISKFCFSFVSDVHIHCFI